MKRFPDKIIIGGHPMAGSVKKGKNAFNGNLFSSKLFFLSFPHKNSRKGEEIVKEIIKSIGAIPFEIDEDTHDFYVSIVSHLPYILSLSLFSIYLDLYKKDREIDDFVSTGFLGATRLALTNPLVGEDIIITNRDHIIKHIERIILELEKAKKKIKRGEISKFIHKINQEAEKRRKIYENVMV